MSSVAAYGDGLNHHEGDALAPDDHPNPYTRNKAMSERALFRMHQRSGFPMVTFGPRLFTGPAIRSIGKRSFGTAFAPDAPSFCRAKATA